MVFIGRWPLDESCSPPLAAIGVFLGQMDEVAVCRRDRRTWLPDIIRFGKVAVNTGLPASQLFSIMRTEPHEK